MQDAIEPPWLCAEIAQRFAEPIHSFIQGRKYLFPKTSERYFLPNLFYRVHSRRIWRISGFAEICGTDGLRERARNGKRKENGLTNAACGHYNVLRQMNSRCICAVRRGALPHGRVMGMRMRFPGYPSNREADERSKAIAQARRRQVG